MLRVRVPFATGAVPRTTVRTTWSEKPPMTRGSETTDHTRSGGAAMSMEASMRGAYAGSVMGGP